MSKSMWGRLASEYTSQLPKFNDYLLKEFRSDKINGIPEHLDMLFKQSIVTIGNVIGPDKPMLKYLTYTILTPEDRIAAARNSPHTYHRVIEIQESTFMTVRFIFEFEGNQVFMNVSVPYTDNGVVYISGVDYHPILTFVERGGMYKDGRSGIVLEVQRANLRFWRGKKVGDVTFKTIEGNRYRETNVTCQLHQAPLQKKHQPPIIAYHLAAHKFVDVMEMYECSKYITLVDEPVEDSNHQHVQIGPNAFILVTNAGLQITKVLRVVISLSAIYKFLPHTGDLSELLDVTYYKLAIGYWCNSKTLPKSKANHDVEAINAKMIMHAENHLQSNMTMVDPAARHQHATIGIYAEDLDELLLVVFNNIDSWLSSHVVNNMYDKKIGTLDQMLSGLVRNFNINLFKILNKDHGLDAKSVMRLMSVNSKTNWIKESAMFRSKPPRYNDNQLLTISGKTLRINGNAELSSKRKGGKKKSKGSSKSDIVKSHPSELIVKSITTLPPSNPINASSINCFLQVDELGNILEPDWAKKYLKDVYK